MPFIIPVLASIGSFLAANAPAITAAATLAGTGVSVGETLSNLPSGGGTQAQPTQPQPSAAAASATDPRAALIAAQAPNVQSQTGGALAPASFSDMLARLTGNPGEGGGVQNILFGSGGQGLSDAYASLTNPLQGNSPTLTQPQGGP